MTLSPVKIQVLLFATSHSLTASACFDGCVLHISKQRTS